MTKGFHEIIIGDTYRTGLGSTSKQTAMAMVKDLRKRNPTLRRMKIKKFRQ
jgi:hypothetical protein